MGKIYHFLKSQWEQHVMRRGYVYLTLWCGMLSAAIPAYSQTFLSASGTKMINTSGQQVILKGCNLGGWCIQEGYELNPAGSSSVGTQWQMKQQYYNEGQTDAQVEAFYQSWRDNFITKADIDYLHSLGFNCVRLPMHFELFLTSAQRAVRNSVIHDSNNYGNYLNSLSAWCNANQIGTDYTADGYKLIDNLLNWCGADGMYVILDMHAAPGDQGSDLNIADGFYANGLWNNAWVFQDVMNRLWLNISSRYKADGRIAFYDLLNEPNNVPGGNQPIHDLLQKLITTIRNNGDNHMLMIEGNGWGNEYTSLEPTTFSPNWGLVYNAHRYGTTTSTTTTNSDPDQLNELGNLVNFSNTYQVPVFVGETGENTDAWMQANIAAINAVGIGWCHWTYKRFDTNEDAAILRIPGSWPTDGASVMSQVLTNIQFANDIKNTNTIAAITSGLTPPATCNTVNIPGTIQAENYCSMSGVQTETTSDTGGGQDVGWIDATDWMSYSVNIPAAGSYAVQYRVASQNGGGIINLQQTGGTVSYGTVSVPSTGGWQTWQTISQTVQLPAGIQNIAIEAGAGGFNLNWFSISSNGSSIPIGSWITLQGNNGMFVTSNNGTSPMTCDRTTAQGWEKFLVVDEGNGQVALQGENGLYVSSENGAATGMNCNRSTVGGWETFTWTGVGSNQVQLKGNNSDYVSQYANTDGTGPLACNRTSAGGWETFNWAVSTKSASVTQDASASSSSVAIYPTLVTNQLTVINSLSGTAQLNVFDLSGRCVLHKLLKNGLNEVDASGLSKGLYITKVTDGSFLKTLKIIKQ